MCLDNFIFRSNILSPQRKNICILWTSNCIVGLLSSLADLFNWTPSQLMWEASSHILINARRLFIHKYSPMPIFIYRLHSRTAECTREMQSERLAQNSTRQHMIRSSKVRSPSPYATTPPHFTVELVCIEETLPLEGGGNINTHDWYEMARLGYYYVGSCDVTPPLNTEGHQSNLSQVKSWVNRRCTVYILNFKYL